MSKEQNGKVKDTHRDFPSWVSTVIICVAVADLIFVTLLFYFMSMGYITEEAFGGGALAMVMSSGISIIAIAVAVWAGLNIANAVERRQLINLQEALTDVEERQRKLKDEEKAYAETIEDIRATQKEEFLIELERLSFDVLSRKLFDVFYIIDIKKEGKSIPWAKLTSIEREFRLIDFAAREKRTSVGLLRVTDGNEFFLRVVDQCVNRIDNLLSMYTMEKNDIVSCYLNIRKGDLYYYRGYESRAHEDFQTTIRLYTHKAVLNQLLNIESKDPGGGIKTLQDSCKLMKTQDKKEPLVAYMCNTIGDSYRIMDDLSNSRVFSEYATVLCPNEITSPEELEAAEIYHRKRGCVLERIFAADGKQLDESSFKATMEEYEKAAKIKLTRMNLKTRLSLIEKYLSAMVGIGFVKIDDNQHRTPKIVDDRYFQTYNSFLPEQKKIWHLRMRELEQLKNTALLMYPGEPLGYEYECVYFRNRFISCGKDAAQKKGVVRKATEAMKKLDYIAPVKRGFTQVIFEDIEEIVKLKR